MVTVSLSVRPGGGDTSGPAAPDSSVPSSILKKDGKSSVCISCNESPALEHAFSFHTCYKCLIILQTLW